MKRTIFFLYIVISYSSCFNSGKEIFSDTRNVTIKKRNNNCYAQYIANDGIWNYYSLHDMILDNVNNGKNNLIRFSRLQNKDKIYLMINKKGFSNYTTYEYDLLKDILVEIYDYGSKDVSTYLDSIFVGDSLFAWHQGSNVFVFDKYTGEQVSELGPSNYSGVPREFWFDFDRNMLFVNSGLVYYRHEQLLEQEKYDTFDVYNKTTNILIVSRKGAIIWPESYCNPEQLYYYYNNKIFRYNLITHIENEMEVYDRNGLIPGENMFVDRLFLLKDNKVIVKYISIKTKWIQKILFSTGVKFYCYYYYGDMYDDRISINARLIESPFSRDDDIIDIHE